MSRLVPFSRDVFLGLFERYNAAVWPGHLVAYAVAVLILLSAVRQQRGNGPLIAAALAAAWVWSGIVFHMTHFATLVWAAWAFGAAFVLQGLLFLVSGVLRDRLAFRFEGGIAGWAGLGLAVFAMAGYPVVGVLAGQSLAQTAPFGLAPCPTAIFTLGILLLAEPPVPLHLLVIPVLWAVVGGAIGWVLDMPRDLALPIAAVLAAVLAGANNRRLRA